MTQSSRSALWTLTQQGRWLRGTRRAVEGVRSYRARSLHHLDRCGTAASRSRRSSADGPPATRTELEDRLHDLIEAGGFVRPDVNVPLMLDGRRVIPDVRWPAQRLVVEADSRQWHDNPQARADDAERQALLEASGERVVPVWEQATAHVAQTQARLAAAGAPRGG